MSEGWDREAPFYFVDGVEAAVAEAQRLRRGGRRRPTARWCVVTSGLPHQEAG
jgi:hypothetical protein